MRRLRFFAVPVVLVALLAGCQMFGVKIKPKSDYKPDPVVVAMEKGDHETAFNLVKPWAENGNHEAQSRLAVLYAKGTYVEKDVVEAMKWAILSDRGGFYGAPMVVESLISVMDKEQVAEAEVRADAWTPKPLPPELKQDANLN